MWHHHSPHELQDKWEGRETRDYKKPEIQSIWDPMEQAAFPAGPCSAQPLLCLPSLPPQDAREFAGAIRRCWAIWLLKPQQRQWEPSLRVLGSPAAPSRKRPGPTALPGAQRLHPCSPQ